MYIISLVLTVIFSIFSTSVMAYISMATPIGPWIAPTLVLLATIIVKGIARSSNATTQAIAFSALGGSIGGILATAFGFSFPTLYFLDSNLFVSWMATPWYFVMIVSVLALAAGGFGLLVANLIEKKLIIEEQMPFPIGQLIYKMIAVQHNIHKAWELVIGFISTMLFCAFQNGVVGLPSLIPTTLRLLQGFQWWIFTVPSIIIRLDQFPMLWAIGFITGHVIAKPLALGALAKILVVDPLNTAFFSSITNEDFLMAFCSGIVIASAGASFLALPKMIQQGWNNWNNKYDGNNESLLAAARTALHVPELIIVSYLVVGFLTYFKFSIFTQLYLVIGAFICTYQIAAIAGKIGLALLGRFATFVMVPAYVLFGLPYMQLVIIATFVEAAGGVATDVLFGRKTAQLAELSHKKVILIQWLGLLVSSVTLGCVMWLLIHHFGLGSEELVAQRSQARALLLNFTSFNYYVLILGALFGFAIEKIFKVSPMLMLGGLLMSLNYSLLLIGGGLSTRLVQKREDWEPFWSGVFAGNSIWVVIRALLK